MTQIVKKEDSTLAISQQKEYIRSYIKNPLRLVNRTEIAKAIDTGTSLRAGDIHLSSEVREFIVREIVRASGIIAANKSFSSDEEMELCVDSLITENPQLKIEEIRTVFDNIIKGKYGKFYERFKVAEVMEAFRQYQAEDRALALEQRQREHLRKSEEEQQEIVNALESYTHKPSFGKTLRDRFTNFGADRAESIKDLKKGILTEEEIKQLKR